MGQKEWDDAEVDRVNAMAALAKKKGYTVKVTPPATKPTANSCGCVDEYVCNHKKASRGD